MSVYRSRHTDSIPTTRQYPGPNVTMPPRVSKNLPNRKRRGLALPTWWLNTLSWPFTFHLQCTDKPGEQTDMYQRERESFVQRLFLESLAGDVVFSSCPRKAAPTD